MRMYDLIARKKHGMALTDAEISYMIEGFVKGEIADYQMSAMLMAIWFRGMSDHETTVLSKVMAAYGDSIDLSPIDGVKVDKHSTGGVGDKTTLIVIPIVAACGGKVAKISGRGLGHTGGTVDKLESIPGYRTSLSSEEFLTTVKKCGACIIGQSESLAIADKKLYALRDVTATVDSIPLIASSIMSKKLAVGSDAILLDVKTGSGAFMKTLEDSILLAKTMVAIGERAGRRTAALVTNMDMPLGASIGNSLEVIESVDVLKGRGPDDIRTFSLELAANMLLLAGKGALPECRAMAAASLADGSAFRAFEGFVKAQGGDVSVLEDCSRFGEAPCSIEVTADRDGYITRMDAERIGIASVILGAGRETKESTIDLAAGMILHKKHGDAVKRGESLATLFTSREKTLPEAERIYREAIKIGDEKPAAEPLVLARVERGGVEMFGA